MGQITIAGLKAKSGEFLVVTGDWDGSTLTVTGFTTTQVGPNKTEMIFVPTGSFLMGNSGVGNDKVYDLQGYCYDEKPQHTVNMPGYWIAKYEVTRGEYRAFMNTGGYSNRTYWSTAGWTWKGTRTQPDYWSPSQTWETGKSFVQVDSDPVVGVSYYEAEAYCKWAGGRLPTEAEWEKAARWTGTHPNIYPWGDEWDADKCNNRYDHNPAGGGYDRFQTAPVGSYANIVSPYGCLDSAGNAWEWCKDYYKADYYTVTPSGGWNNPQGPSTGTTRSLRGGGWIYGICGNSAICCRCANRSNADPIYQLNVLGFRMAR